LLLLSVSAGVVVAALDITVDRMHTLAAAAAAPVVIRAHI